MSNSGSDTEDLPLLVNPVVNPVVTYLEDFGFQKTGGLCVLRSSNTDIGTAVYKQQRKLAEIENVDRLT